MKALLHSKPSLIKAFAILLLIVLSSVTTNAQNVVLEETFDNFDGSGPINGDTNSWSALKLQEVTTADLPSGWTISKAVSKSVPSVRKAKECVCVGATTTSKSSTDLAYIQTSPIKEVGTYLLTFRAGAWNTANEKATLKLGTSSDGNIKFETNSFKLEKATFKTFSTKITILKENSPIRFKNIDRASSRFFLDDIKVEKSPVGTISIVAPEGYGTYYTDKSFIMPKGVDGAIVSDISDDGKLQINWKYPAGTTVPANTGLLVYASQKGSYQCYEAGSSDNGGSNGSSDLSGNAANGIGQTNNEVAGSAAQETNYLRGTIEKIQVPEDASSYRFYQLTYGLVENVRTIGFFYASEDGGTFINGANKAYLAIPRSMSSVSSLYSLSHNLGTTGIDQSLTETMHDHAPCTIYSITGQRLTATDSRQLPKGVYIIKGKKIMVK